MNDTPDNLESNGFTELGAPGPRRNGTHGEFGGDAQAASESGALACRERMLAELDEAERKAIDSLARYKFQMFGYWAAIWVHMNRLSGAKRKSPFGALVNAARIQREGY